MTELTDEDVAYINEQADKRRAKWREHIMSFDSKKEYRYREGAHGEHCIDYGQFDWRLIDTIGKAATKEDAIRLVAELNTIQTALAHR